MRIGCLDACLLALTIAYVGAVKELTTDNWHELKRGEWMVKFYAPWCPACRHFNGIWSKFEDQCLVDNLDVQVAKVDVDKYPTLGGRVSLRKLPTVFHVKNGEYRQYDGDRALNALVDWVKNSEYEKVEPLSMFWHPDNVPMVAFSYLYAVSVQVKAFQDWFVEQQGYSSSLFFVVFFVAFILCGLLLGLILVMLSLFFEWLYALLTGKAKQRSADARAQQSRAASATTTAATGEDESSEADDAGLDSASSGGEQPADSDEASRDVAAGARVRQRKMPRKD